MKKSRIFRKEFITSIAVIMLAGSAVTAETRAENTANISVTLNNEYVDCSQQAPIKIDNRVLVPLRAIFEALGADVDWINETQTVIAQTDDVTFKMIIGDVNYTVNGVNKISDVAPRVLNGSTMVPVRVVSESLGCEVDWDNDNQIVLITSAQEEETISLITEDIQSAMLALKEEYPDGTTWTNDNTYQPLTKYYSYAGGCAGFAHMLSDAAFGLLPERRVENSDSLEYRVGDIVRVNNDTHSVCILDIDENGLVTIAEGNLSGAVKWGRTYSASTFKKMTDYIITRYPE